MAQSGGARGGMNIQDQKDTFHGFLVASIWTSGLIAQGVVLLTLAFAIGLGWWAGFGALVVLGIAVGLIFRMTGVYWAVQVVLWALLGLGGMIIPAISSMMG